MRFINYICYLNYAHYIIIYTVCLVMHTGGGSTLITYIQHSACLAPRVCLLMFSYNYIHTNVQKIPLASHTI